jgi:predicted transcriptional regulator
MKPQINQLLEALAREPYFSSRLLAKELGMTERAMDALLRGATQQGLILFRLGAFELTDAGRARRLEK